MANTHRYGFRFVRSISGNDTPQIFTLPIADDYAPVTIVGAGTSVNLNIGDPVNFAEDGTVRLVQQGQASDGSDTDDYAFGIIVGFPRVIVGGYPRPGSYYTSGTSYSGGIGGDNAPLVSIIPVAGNIFEIDCDTAHTTPTKSGLMGLVGGTGNMIYSVLTSGSGQPKANPYLDVSDVVLNSAEINQLRVVGLGKAGDAMDFTATNVTLQVMWNEIMPAPGAISGIAGTTVFIE
jgi:hypothetical protein